MIFSGISDRLRWKLIRSCHGWRPVILHEAHLWRENASVTVCALLYPPKSDGKAVNFCNLHWGFDLKHFSCRFKLFKVSRNVAKYCPHTYLVFSQILYSHAACWLQENVLSVVDNKGPHGNSTKHTFWIEQRGQKTRVLLPYPKRLSYFLSIGREKEMSGPSGIERFCKHRVQKWKSFTACL